MHFNRWMDRSEHETGSSNLQDREAANQSVSPVFVGPMLEAGQKIYPANTPNKFAISKLTAAWDIAMGSDKDSSKDRH